MIRQKDSGYAGRLVQARATLLGCLPSVSLIVRLQTKSTQEQTVWL